MVFQMQQIQYQFSVTQAGLSQINHGQSFCTEGALTTLLIYLDCLAMGMYGQLLLTKNIM